MLDVALSARGGARRGARALLLLAAAWAAAGCAEAGEGRYFGSTERAGKDPGTIYINGVGEPESMDPAISNDTLAGQYTQQMFEGLTAYGPSDLRPVQGVARAWDRSDDGLLYRFHLRPEARWSDGKPVVAGDFEYAWKRVLRPETGSRTATDLFPLKNAEAFNAGRIKDDRLIGVRALDDATLEVELERPTPYLLDLTSRPSYAPVRRDVIEAAARRGPEELWTRPETIVVNGPFTLDSWRFRYEITMKQNPHYWAKGSLRVKRIVWLEVDSSRSAMHLYRTAELDLFGNNIAPAPEYGALVGRAADTRRFPILMTYWYELNTRVPPLNDPRVRRALDLAVDKRQLVQIIPGTPLPAEHIVPESTGGGYAELLAAERAAGRDPFAGRAHDPARARALLAEAGHEITEEHGERRAKGFPPLEIIYNTGDDGHQRVAVAVQDMWKRHLGVSVTLRAEEWKVMLSSYQERQFQVIRFGWTADYNHPSTFLDTFRENSPVNYTGWSDPETDALLDRGTAAADPAEGMRLFLQAERRIVDGMAKIPLFFGTGITLVKPWVKGYRGNGQARDLIRWLWVDPAWRDHPGDEPAGPPLEMPPPGRIEGR
ncbi:MAG: peptide ABC transporter substrate-binding protein [Polyangiaceae bacterium]|nr:peptide ABC transporter substrate-binding protein [Polyangiaceae bacterium]